MKFFLKILLLLITPFNILAQTELEGNWTGTLYQKPWDGSSGMMKYKYSMKLEIVNGKIEGKSTIITGPNFAVILLKGEFKDNVFTFEEYKIENQKVAGMSWCLKGGSIKLHKSGGELKLAGDWTGYVNDPGGKRRDCNPGNLEIVKEQGFISLKGFTIDEKTQTAISSDIKIINKTSGKEVSNIRSASNGEFDIKLPGSNEYELTVAAKGYITRFEYVTLNSSQIVNIALTPIQVGQTVPLKHILFEKGTSNLTKESTPELERLLKFMNDNPSVNIELRGHTSNEGDNGKNMILSEQRVKTIKDYLVKNGINEKRLVVKGFGSTKPVAPNDTEENKKLNRRVEFVILRK